ncbi:MAG TPA: IPT/TIG domain-containing protein, partial [Puia sp.]|nr:IPT/TIG domain-containing protein [Puia sp.]
MKKILISFLIVWGSARGILTKLHKLVYSTLLLTTLFCVLSECSKHPGHLSTTNYVSAVTPSSGTLGDTIIITGTNFNSEPYLDTVSFNGVLAQVVSATSSSITAIVPPGAMTGYLTVNGKNSVATNKTMFTVINVYVCGTLYNAYGNPGQSIVWENGVPVILSSNSASANAISVSGSDVYVAGIEDSG